MKEDITDPKYVGPGTWNVIHRMAFNANTMQKQKIFIDYMKDICTGFPCTVCRGHCQDYIENNPMEHYLGKNIEIDGEKKPLGMFLWAWEFHNAVNKRIKKEQIPIDSAYNMYSDENNLVCSLACLEAEEDVNEVSKTKAQMSGSAPSKILKLYRKTR